MRKEQKGKEDREKERGRNGKLKAGERQEEEERNRRKENGSTRSIHR